MKRLSEFETIEEFWGTIDNVPPPSKLPVGCNYHLCVCPLLSAAALSLHGRGVCRASGCGGWAFAGAGAGARGRVQGAGCRLQGSGVHGGGLDLERSLSALPSLRAAAVVRVSRGLVQGCCVFVAAAVLEEDSVTGSGVRCAAGRVAVCACLPCACASLLVCVLVLMRRRARRGGRGLAACPPFLSPGSVGPGAQGQ